MSEARLTRKRLLIGTVFVILGMVIINIILFYLGLQGSFESQLLFFLSAFCATAIIMFGWAIMGSFPIKKLLISLVGMALWCFLFALPISLSTLPSEVQVLIISFSLILLALLIGLYERKSFWRKLRD